MLAHEVARSVAGRTEVPVALMDVAPPEGGPFICLDLTAYADPISTRSTRCAFSSHQKALVQGLAVEPGYVFAVPRDGPDTTMYSSSSSSTSVPSRTSDTGSPSIVLT